jgi:UDP-N-acetylglucosamine 1-carboxyvinyltransferase
MQNFNSIKDLKGTSGEQLIRRNFTAFVSGGNKPIGRLRISGAKNAATRLLAAALIADEPVVLGNFPTQLIDANYKIDFIKKCGGLIDIDDNAETIRINSSNLEDVLLDHYNYPIRTTYLLVPGLIKHSGKARIPYPGGCRIGARGYDLHVMVWENLGAIVRERQDYIEVEAPTGFKPGIINFPISTIGGTEDALICASTIQGETIIKNAYISPEIDNLIQFLRTLGAKIDVVGNSFIKIQGRKILRGSIFEVMPDRIEALTWFVYGVLSGGRVTIEDVPFNAMEIPLIHLKEAGIDYYANSRNINISPDCLLNGTIQPFELATGTYPGVISDMQPFFVLLGLYADGISRVFDYRYPDRTKYLEELAKFYPGQLEWERGAIKIFGRKDVVPETACAFSTDLRGSMVLLLAALLSPGESTIKNAEMAFRGYNKLEKKLVELGILVNIVEEY